MNDKRAEMVRIFFNLQVVKMDINNLKKEIQTIKKALKNDKEPGAKALGVFARIDLYKKIYDSPEFSEYKKAMQTNDTMKLKEVKVKIPKSMLPYFKRCYDFETKRQFDLINYVEGGNDEN